MWIYCFCGCSTHERLKLKEEEPPQAPTPASGPVVAAGGLEPPTNKPLNPDSLPKCPKCRELFKRLEAGLGADGDALLSVKGGLRLWPSTKLRHVKAWLDAIPPGEKAIVFSYFKGFLDLVEGIMSSSSSSSEAVCERFDGDLEAKYKAAALTRFKEEDGCRFLLATV